MSIIKRVCMIVMAVAFVSSNGLAQGKATFVSPGFNMGYLFGADGGFVMGLELSATHWPSERAYFGVVAKYDIWAPASSKFHLGGEFAFSPVGLSFGPTWAVRNGQVVFGYTGSVYTGLILMPYYSYSWFADGWKLGEVGGYLKLPLRVGGPPVGWSN